MWKEPFLLATQIKLLIFLFIRCLHTQKLLLFLCKTRFFTPKCSVSSLICCPPRSNKGRWHQVPMLEMTLKSTNSANMNVRVRQKRDPKPKQSKTEHFYKMRRGGFMLVVFYTFFIFARHLKKKWEESFLKRVYSSCLCVEEVKAHRLTGSRSFPGNSSCPPLNHFFTTCIPSHSRELRHIRELKSSKSGLDVLVDNLCSVKQQD